MDVKQILVTVGIMLFGSLLTFIATSYWSRKGLAAAAAAKAIEIEATAKAEQQSRIADLEKRLAATEQVVSPISQIMMDALRKQLTHADTPILDAHLESLTKPEGLSTTDKAELLQLLEERSKDMRYSESERDAAHMMPAMMRRVESSKRAMDPANYLITPTPAGSSNPVTEKKAEEGTRSDSRDTDGTPIVTLKVVDADVKPSTKQE